ncbi:serine/threonine protein kinase [Paenibacillaceae bacterium GAS479]|nr:serine/threonine protein kinase [Paenibacillaceae bacterium GAS479]
MRSENTGRRIISDEATFLPGDIAGGRYRILRQIGEGGMGQVYAAEDMRLDGRLRALKLKPAGGAGELLSVEEARMQMQLSHAHLPQLYDYFPAEKGRGEMLVMDYVEGHTLEELIAARGTPMSATDTASIALQLCSALGYLHAQSPPIIHRDLKPSNVMIERAGGVKLIDFGIARRFLPSQAADTTQLGTPGFAAPEQLAGEQSDARTDMYGLGCLLCLLLTGKPPELALRGHAGRAALPPWLERLLQPERSRRFANMIEAAGAIADWAAVDFDGKRNNHPAAGLRLGGFSKEKAAGNSQQAQLSILSLSPGSGATFITLMLARLLAEIGLPVQAIEIQSGQPHWHALLGANSGSLPTALDPRYVTLREGGVEWLLKGPRTRLHSRLDDEARLGLMLHGEGHRVQLLDWSSDWKGPDALSRLRSSSLIIAVADPDPSRWSAERMELLEKLNGELRTSERGTGKGILWAANKDVAFAGRREWLSMLPNRPDAFIPFLPPEDWYMMLWQGFPLPHKGRSANRLRAGLKPLVEAVQRRLQTT